MTDIYEWRVGVTYTLKSRRSCSGRFEAKTIEEAIGAAKVMLPMDAEDISVWSVDHLGLAKAENQQGLHGDGI